MCSLVGDGTAVITKLLGGCPAVKIYSTKYATGGGDKGATNWDEMLSSKSDIQGVNAQQGSSCASAEDCIRNLASRRLSWMQPLVHNPVSSRQIELNSSMKAGGGAAISVNTESIPPHGFGLMMISIILASWR